MGFRGPTRLFAQNACYTPARNPVGLVYYFNTDHSRELDRLCTWGDWGDSFDILIPKNRHPDPLRVFVPAEMPGRGRGNVKTAPHLLHCRGLLDQPVVAPGGSLMPSLLRTKFRQILLSRINCSPASARFRGRHPPQRGESDTASRLPCVGKWWQC